MTYMTAMDRLEMCCIFLLEGLQTTRDGTWWQAELCCDTWGGEGLPVSFLPLIPTFYQPWRPLVW